MTESRKNVIIKTIVSPLAGETDFQYEQNFVSIRKSSEGYVNQPFITPRPIFQILKNLNFFRIEKSPPPQGWRIGKGLRVKNAKILQTIRSIFISASGGRCFAGVFLYPVFSDICAEFSGLFLKYL